MTPRYVVWPENQPEKAVFAYSWLGKEWIAFRMGWPKPWKLLELYRVNRAIYDKRFDQHFSPVAIARCWDALTDGFNNYYKRSGKF